MTEDIFHLGIKALLRDDQGRVLLLKVNPAKLHGGRADYWDLPGGRVQKGDSIADTLRREVKEETGITNISNLQEIGMVLSNIRIPLGEGESAGLILNIFSCEIPEDAAVQLSDEHIASQWVTPAEAAQLLRVKYPQAFCDTIAQLQ